MSSTLLEIVQRFIRRQGLNPTGSVVGSSDRGVDQARGLLEEFLDDMVTRKCWAQVTREATFVTQAQESQGRIFDLTDGGFASIKLNSMWDRTQMLPIEGGENSESWQAMHAINLQGPLPKARLWQNELWLYPVPAAGHTIAFEYFTTFTVTGSDQVRKRYWTEDSDTCVFDDALPTAYLRWAWKREKGLDYSEEFNRYEQLIATFAVADSAPRMVDLSSTDPVARPGIVVPPGSWPL